MHGNTAADHKKTYQTVMRCTLNKTGVGMNKVCNLYKPHTRPSSLCRWVKKKEAPTTFRGDINA